MNCAKAQQIKGARVYFSSEGIPGGSLLKVRDHTQTDGCQLSTREEAIEGIHDAHEVDAPNMNLEAVVVNLAPRNEESALTDVLTRTRLRSMIVVVLSN